MSEYEEYVCRFYPDSWGEKSITLFGVPIVRCRDCKFGVDGGEYCAEDCADSWDWRCVEPDGFCAWGERKANA